jgi:hypothetical protein
VTAPAVTVQAEAGSSLGDRWVCPKCTGLHGAHFLTCPVLRLPQGVALFGDERDGRS